MEYTIRTCEIADLPKLVILCQKHAEYEKADYDSTGKEEGLIKALFDEQPQLHCLVVSTPNDIVGYVSYSFLYSTWDAGNIIHMDCLYLEEQARNYGIGEVLINKLNFKILKTNLVSFGEVCFFIDCLCYKTWSSIH